MGSALNDTAVIQYDNFFTVADRGQTVGNDDACDSALPD